MAKKLIVVSIMTAFLSVSTGLSAADMNNRLKERSIIIVGGKVTKMRGNVVTVRDQSGAERILQLNSVKGIRPGARVWCEEDCRTGMKIGGRPMRVQRILK